MKKQTLHQRIKPTVRKRFCSLYQPYLLENAYRRQWLNTNSEWLLWPRILVGGSLACPYLTPFLDGWEVPIRYAGKSRSGYCHLVLASTHRHVVMPILSGAAMERSLLLNEGKPSFKCCYRDCCLARYYAKPEEEAALNPNSAYRYRRLLYRPQWPLEMMERAATNRFTKNLKKAQDVLKYSL